MARRMLNKKAFIVLFLLLALFPLCEINAETTNVDLSKSNTFTFSDFATKATGDFTNFIKEKTPSFIAKPVVYLAIKIDGYRKIIIRPVINSFSYALNNPWIFYPILIILIYWILRSVL